MSQATPMHSLLRRQLRRHRVTEGCPGDGDLSELFVAIDSAYHEFDRDRELLERSLEVSSEELMEANCAMQAVFDASPDLFIWIDRSGLVRRIHCDNPRDLAAHHVDGVQFVGMHISTVPDPMVSASFDAALAQACRGHATSFEYELSVAGGIVSYEARLLPLPTRQILAIIRNISERKTAEEQRFRQLAEHIDEVLWMIDARTNRILYVSPAYERVWGRDTASLYEDCQSFVYAIHPDDRARVVALLPERTKGGYDVQYRVIRPDGETRWIRDRAFPVLDQTGAVYRVTGIAADITAAKQREESIEALNSELAQRVRTRTTQLMGKSAELEETKRHYQLLFEHSNDAVVLVDRDRKVLEVNQRASHQFAYGRSAFGQMRATELFAPHAREVAVALFERLDLGEPARVEVECQRADGSVFWSECSGGRIKTDAGAMIQLVVRDVTARKEAAAALETSHEQLRQAQKMEAVGRLAGGVAHDFNNILSAIMSYSAFVLEEESITTEVRGDVEVILQSARRAADLTHQLLAYSRRQVLQPQLLNLNDVVAGTRTMLKPLIGEDIDLQLELEGPIPRVMIDPGQLGQIVMNLALNARDAMPHGGELRIRTARASIPNARVGTGGECAPGEYVTLAVTDTGSGIPPELLPNIFEPFFTTKAAGSGTGLGLATVFGIVKQSGGHMEVDSRPDHGTTFTIFLPVIAVPTLVPVVSSIQPVRKGNGLILLVEDEELVRNVATRVLERAGYHVIGARSGIEALEYLATTDRAIDLLLTDVVMPRMSGRELAETVRKLQPEARILYMTGYTDDAIVRYGVFERTVELLQKPFTPNELLQRVGGILEDTQRLTGSVA